MEVFLAVGGGGGGGGTFTTAASKRDINNNQYASWHNSYTHLNVVSTNHESVST